ncbi:LacI family DNA-binding transcriptional regulator [Dermacoccus abyssi]|uniref:substrate-binding domain-containing protein n=1 Tax=Dermacoccus abyssi TaxID=322596 RepID=UPI002AD3EA61|nr:substrate-binding domain-containing protein [Dermacoccus abyssi]
MNPEALDRTAGFLEVFPDALVITAGESSIEGGYEASERLFSDSHSVTAIAAQSDLMAVGAIRSIGAHGLSTRADISVAGFDGIDLLCWWAP